MTRVHRCRAIPPNLVGLATLIAVVCTNGRPSLSQDEDRQLFAESAGTCLLCNTRLFAALQPGMRSMSITERAHVVAYADRGPRADVSLSAEDRNDPSNIVLLCPTCHTKVDKAPEAFPTETLLARKASRRAAVELVGGTPTFDSRDAARRAVAKILERNRVIFNNYGPSPDDGSHASREEADRWRRHVLEDIVPGNELVVAIVDINESLASGKDREAAELLRLHTQDLAEKHGGSDLMAQARRFPATANEIFAEPADA
jgi:hypothetical protein